MGPQPAALANGHPTTPSKLPIILCLHGGGTGSTIFNIQTIRVQRLLVGKFEFVFLDGPFEIKAGPGVLPVFEGCGPFLSWMEMHENRLQDETKWLIQRAMKGKEKEFVGVMGFSQGAKLAAGLLLEQQLKGKEEGFKFGIFLNGTNPPIVSSALTEEERALQITVPSFHVVGSEDPWRYHSRNLFGNHFDKKFSKIVEFKMGHRLPTLDADTRMIADEILRLHRETSRET